MQTLGISIFLVFAAITVAIFIFVALSTRTPGELPEKGYKQYRFLIAVGLTALALILLVLTLPINPYPNDKVTPDRVIYATGKQFAFKLADEEITPEDAMDDEVFFTSKPIRTGDLIEFRVTGADVTHGFSIFDPAGQIHTQTQVMPQYINRLRYRFPKAGTYHVFCFELCGIGHPTMKAQLEVQDNPTDPEAVATN